MRWPSVALVAVVLVFATGASTAYIRDQLAPTFAALNLRDGQVGVAPTQVLKLRLTRPADPASLVHALRIDPVALFSLVPAADRRSFTLKPADRLADLTRYTLSLRSFRDKTGHLVERETWHFTTAIIPRVTRLTAADDGDIKEGSEVELGQSLKIAFNEPLATRGLEIRANGTPVQLAWSADGLSATIGTAGMRIGPLALMLTPGATDAQGRRVEAWKVDAKLVFRIHIDTIPLRFPALVQIPNDGYGARDQSGYQAADMVFEYQTEGGITRTTALFTNAPAAVGPIRSGRYISFPLVRHYHGMLFLSGLSNPSYARLHANPVPAFFDTAGYYYRSRDRAAPNNLYISGDAIQRAENGSALGAFSPPSKGDPALTGGQAVTTVNVPEHDSAYSYDAATGTYGKTEDGHTMADATLRQPLHIWMLVVMHTREWVTADVEDVGGGRARDFDMDSGGSAEIYYQGQEYNGRWSAPTASSPYLFTLADGRTLTLPTGLVWVDVVS